jgi:hypothetical protein
MIVPLIVLARAGRAVSDILEAGMAGEIRARMEALRAARAKMVAEMSAEIDAVTKEVATAHADGLEAMKLPRAELDATKAEIREIRAEFSTASNGGPAGPLPGSPVTSSAPSAVSRLPTAATADTADDGKSSIGGV